MSELTAAVGGRHVIFVPVPGYRDDTTGDFLEPAELDAGQWRTMIRATDELGKMVAEEYGLRLQFHPHADSHVETQAQTERFLDETDPRYVNLCLDTGHLAYRHADNVALINRYPDRIGYVHIKQMDPAIVAKADREGLAFGQAVAMGASCEPPAGEPVVEDVAKALHELGRDLFVVVEQDMYPIRLRQAQADRPAHLHLPARHRHWRRGVTMSVRVGVIGVGMIGQDHIRRITQVLTGGSVTAVNDVDAARAGQVAAGLPGAVTHPTAQDLIADGNVDAVLVASWGPAHEEQVVAAIAAGKPVFCEKPLAPSRDACQRIMDAEMAAGRRLVQVGFMRRYDAGYRAMKAALDDGGLGAPLLMHCAHRNPSVPDYGFTTDMIISDSSVHEIDIVRWLFGEEIVAASVLTPRRSRHAPEGLQDPLILVLEMSGGALVDDELFVSARYGYDVRGEVVCETGTVALADVGEVTVRTQNRHSGRVPVDWRDRFIRAYDTELQEWLNAVAAGTATGPTSWDGFAAAVVTDAALEALRTGQRTAVSMPERPEFYAK